MGNVIKKIDLSGFEEKVNKANALLEREEEMADNLAESPAFNLMVWAKRYDDWFLDPLVGLFIPGVGDFLSSLATLPALHVAIFKVRSARLALAIFCGMMIDLIVGAIPIGGDLFDALFKSNKRAYRLIVGYVEDDEATKEEVNKRAVQGVIILIVIGLLVYFFIELILKIFHWFQSLL